MFDISNQDFLGVGVNYRSAIGSDIFKYIDYIDLIEINTEKFFISVDDEHVKNIMSRIPYVFHGLGLSIGAFTEADEVYQQQLSNIVNTMNCKWFSEHLAATREGKYELRNLMPIRFSEDLIERITQRVKKLQRETQKPFLLENITYYYPAPGSNIEEASFIKRILEESNCYMLLDLNNLYINAKNHRYDPYTFLKSIPLERVVEIHLAGLGKIQDLYIDTHAASITQEVLDLFDFACKSIPFKAVIIERDSNLDRFEDLLSEVTAIKNTLEKHKLSVRR